LSARKTAAEEIHDGSRRGFKHCRYPSLHLATKAERANKTTMSGRDRGSSGWVMAVRSQPRGPLSPCQAYSKPRQVAPKEQRGLVCGQGDMALNLSLKFYSLVNPVASEQGLGCHGGHRAKQRQAARNSNRQPTSQPVAAPSTNGSEGAVVGAAGQTESHAYQGVPSPGKCNHRQPGRPRLIAGIADDGGQRGLAGEDTDGPGGTTLCVSLAGSGGNGSHVST
jgi:hypothetical protein